MADSGQWRVLKETIEKAVPGARGGSAYRPGDPGHHGSGNALDITGPMQQVFEFLVRSYPGSEEIIYTPGGSRQIKNGAPHTYSAGVAADHFDHVHWAAKNLTAASKGQAPQAGTGGGGVADVIPGLTAFTSFFSNTSMWARLAVGVIGGILLLMSFALITGNSLFKSLDLGGVVKTVRKVAGNGRR